MLWNRIRQGWSVGILSLALLTLPQPAQAAGEHYVFAHYMVCLATYGESVEGYKREIREAQSAGVDGFILDIGVWNHPVWTYYNRRTALIYQAAEELGTGFKLSLFVEFPEATNIIDLVKTYGNRPNTLRQNGEIVLSSWGMNDVPAFGWVGVDWKNEVLDPLRQAGFPVFFVPHFNGPYAPELPTYSDAEAILRQDGSFIQGLFLFGAAGQPASLAQCNSNYTAALHAAGKIFMASYTPNYWGCQQLGLERRYYESYGGEGTILQWKSIIQNQPDWVDLVTWNDYEESTYCSPVDSPEQYGMGFLSNPHRNNHSGYLELSKHYITWFKTGQEPAIDRDALFFFYRTHAKNAVATDTNDLAVTWQTGDVQDVLYTTVFLKNPAQLIMASGGQLTTNSLPAGISSVRAPFSPGAQTFTLQRNGRQVLSVQGPDVQAQIAHYNFFPASGFGYGLHAPANLNISGN